MASEQTDAVELIEGDVVTKLSGAVLIAALTGVLAQFSIPLPGGIPFSFQPFAVFFSGLLLGPIWGGFAMALYVLVGVAGAPVFSTATAGIGVIFGPTGGFLLSYPIASFAIGYLAHQSLSARPVGELSTVPVIAGLLVGQVPIYVLGTVWFASQQGLAIAEGAAIMWPFFVGDLIKIAITVGIIRGGAEVLDGRL